METAYYPHNARATYHEALERYMAAPRRSEEARAALGDVEAARVLFLRALGED